MNDKAEKWRDLMLYGVSFENNGQRVPPSEIFKYMGKDPKEELDIYSKMSESFDE